MLMIRLQRLGKKKHPSYRVIVSDKRRDTQGKHLDAVGIYNPSSTPKLISLNNERILYWLGVGAQSSATVHNLLVNAGVIKEKKRGMVSISHVRKAKLAKAAA